MKLNKLKENLKKIVDKKRHPLRQEIDLSREIKKRNRDNLIIIGITGSRGKSTTAYLIHKYLKSIGKKSILYSSICVDSPFSYINEKDSCDMPIKDESTLLDIVEQTEAYEAEYLILEVSERAINNGLVKDIPFDVKVLTNLNPYHNKDFYDPSDYVEIKKSFFLNSTKDVINIMGLTDPSIREIIQDLVDDIKGKNILFGSRYIASVSSFDESKIDYLLTEKDDSINGLKLGIVFNNVMHWYKTNMLLSHNALNICCAVATLNSIRCYNEKLFNEFISNVEIPGREVVVKYDNRRIIVGMSLMPMLEELKKYQFNNQTNSNWPLINNIKVVVGAPGLNHKTWIKDFSDEVYLKEQVNSRKVAMEYLDKYADYIYITESDSGATPLEEITANLVSYLNKKDNYEVVLDREEAIKKAIVESHENDIIYISGRGNRTILCDGESSVKYVNDLSVVKKIIKDLRKGETIWQNKL